MASSAWPGTIIAGAVDGALLVRDRQPVAGVDAQAIGGGLRQQDGVVPGHLGDRAAAAPAARRCWRSGRREPWESSAKAISSPLPRAVRLARQQRPGRLGQRSGVHGQAPSVPAPVSGTSRPPSQRSQTRVERAAGGAGQLGQRPVARQQRVRAQVPFAEEGGQHVGFGLAAPQRRRSAAERCDDAVADAAVAPRLQRVRGRDEVLADRRRLVLVEGVIDDVRHALQQLGQLEVGRSRCTPGCRR